MPRFATPFGKASRLALAAALLSAGAIGAVAFEAPAAAQSKPKYSKEFIAGFGPVDEAMQKAAEAEKKGETPDYAALRDQALAARDSIQNEDDRYAFGSTLQVLGEKLGEIALRREGMDLMLASGKVPAADVPRYTYIAGQLAFNDEDYPAARQRFEEAQALGYQDPQLAALITATYERDGDVAGSLTAIAKQINDLAGAGQTPPKELISRGLTIAYNNDLYDDATNFSLLLAKYYPDRTSWGDAIAVQRNFGDYSDAELLDLLRLLRAAGAMRETRDYTDYIDAANFRRLPGEVAELTREGIDAGKLEAGDTFVREALSESNSRTAGLRADLGALESDAQASGAGASLALAAGDAFLNFGEGAKAAELYQLALTRPDVDRGTALTRLGIAQVKAGDYAAAQETFAQVEGNRKPIARLWAAYAAQQATGG